MNIWCLSNFIFNFNFKVDSGMKELITVCHVGLTVLFLDLMLDEHITYFPHITHLKANFRCSLHTSLTAPQLQDLGCGHKHHTPPLHYANMSQTGLLLSYQWVGLPVVPPSS